MFGQILQNLFTLETLIALLIGVAGGMVIGAEEYTKLIKEQEATLIGMSDIMGW